MTRATPSSEAELARLADGSLPSARRAALEASLSQSPERAAGLAEQERVVSMLRAVDEPAPAALRARIDAMSAAAAPAHRRRTRRLVLAMGSAAGLALAVLAVILTGGGSPSPGVPQVARLALASSTLPAPREDGAHPGLLVRRVDGVTFPYWEVSLGWRADGARTDTVQTRKIVTVFYTDRSGTRIGYSIVAGPALAVHSKKVIDRNGTQFSLLQQGKLRVITWLRAGHTCVIAGRGVSEAALLRLAGANHARPLAA